MCDCFRISSPVNIGRATTFLSWTDFSASASTMTGQMLAVAAAPTAAEQQQAITQQLANNLTRQQTHAAPLRVDPTVTREIRRYLGWYKRMNEAGLCGLNDEARTMTRANIDLYFQDDYVKGVLPRKRMQGTEMDAPSGVLLDCDCFCPKSPVQNCSYDVFWSFAYIITRKSGCRTDPLNPLRQFLERANLTGSFCCGRSRATTPDGWVVGTMPRWSSEHCAGGLPKGSSLFLVLSEDLAEKIQKESTPDE